MHVSNFGVFASAERNLVFGINDFDETMPGPWEWDWKRLAASAVVGGQFLGGDRENCGSFSRTVVSSYRKHIRELAKLGYLATWYATINEKDLFDVTSKKLRDDLQEILDKAKKRSHLQVLEKMTDLIDNQHRIVESAPFVVHETKAQCGMPIRKLLAIFLQQYLASLSPDRRKLILRYRVMDVARKLVGVGSVGTHCWIVYMQGVDENDPLFLQVKEAQVSVLSRYVGAPFFQNQGLRVVSGQRLIQASPDILLGWGTSAGVQFYVRQLRDMKGSYQFDPETGFASRFPEVLRALWVGACSSACEIGRCRNDCRLCRQERCSRRGLDRVRLCLQRTERSRLRGTEERSAHAPDHSFGGLLSYERGLSTSRTGYVKWPGAYSRFADPFVGSCWYALRLKWPMA
jgi:Uncharacterized protein conserved in bacteria (DUF2252)